MKDRKKFIECVYDSHDNILKVWPRYGYKKYKQCTPEVQQLLFSILNKSGNAYIDDMENWHIEGSSNTKNETYELDVCILIISLIVVSKFKKSNIKFEQRINTYCKTRSSNGMQVATVSENFCYKTPIRLRNFFIMARNILMTIGNYDMSQLFNDLLDSLDNDSIAFKWMRATF